MQTWYGGGPDLLVMPRSNAHSTKETVSVNLHLDGSLVKSIINQGLDFITISMVIISWLLCGLSTCLSGISYRSLQFNYCRKEERKKEEKERKRNQCNQSLCEPPSTDPLTA